MLFDIFNYNIHVAIFSLVIFFALLVILFYKFITSAIDPLVYHLIWISAILVFFVIYFQARVVNIYFYLFLASLVFYIASLFIFCKHYRIIKKKSSTETKIFIPKEKFIILLLVSIALGLFSNKNFILYAFTQAGSIQELFVYRFTLLQGRDPLQRMASAIMPFMYLFIFYGIHMNIYRKICLLTLLIFLFIGLVSGGRASVLITVYALGFYIFFFSGNIARSVIKAINKYSIIAISFGLLFAIYVTSHFNPEYDLVSASATIFNRVFASADGIEYFLNYDGHTKIETGISAYFNSIFGIYMQNLFGIEYRNIGWQLTELVVGNVEFAQGANYIVILQGFIFNPYLAPLYAAVMGCIVAKIRYAFSSNIVSMPLIYAVSSLAFVLPSDIEFFTLMLISTILIYILFIYPSIKVRFA